MSRAVRPDEFTVRRREGKAEIGRRKLKTAVNGPSRSRRAARGGRDRGSRETASTLPIHALHELPRVGPSMRCRQAPARPCACRLSGLQNVAAQIAVGGHVLQPLVLCSMYRCRWLSMPGIGSRVPTRVGQPHEGQGGRTGGVPVYIEDAAAADRHSGWSAPVGAS